MYGEQISTGMGPTEEIDFPEARKFWKVKLKPIMKKELEGILEVKKKAFKS